jgi:hypothetical protein
VAESLRVDMHPRAIAVGDAWATEIVGTLRADEREIVGSWPGTMSEARMRIRTELREKLELDVIEELARLAYLTARRCWQELAEADSEL